MPKVNLRSILLILCILLLVSCSSPEDKSNNKAEKHVSDTVETTNMKVDTNEDNSSEKGEDRDSKEEVSDKEEQITESELNKVIEKQPLRVIETDYIVQDDQHKSLYPDML